MKNAYRIALLCASLSTGLFAGCHDAPAPRSERLRLHLANATATNEGLHTTLDMTTEEAVDGFHRPQAAIGYGVGLRPSAGASGISP